jgi:hypothetical protein
VNGCCRQSSGLNFFAKGSVSNTAEKEIAVAEGGTTLYINVEAWLRAGIWVERGGLSLWPLHASLCTGSLVHTTSQGSTIRQLK